MTKGLVMEVDKRHVLVMTSDGQFCRIKQPKHFCQVGEEISFSLPQQRTMINKPIVKYMATAAAVLLVIAMVLPQILFTPVVAAYVTLDINPSVELQINKEQEVIGATSLNEEAELLLSDIEYKRQPLHIVTSIWIQKSIEAGYLTDAGDVFITTTTVSELDVSEETLDAELVETVKMTIADSKKDVVVTAVAVPEEVREKAKSEGISSGKYMLYISAKQQGIDVKVEDIKKQSIKEITKKHEQLKQYLEVPPNKEEVKGWLKQLEGTLQLPTGEDTPMKDKDKEKDKDKNKGNGHDKERNDDDIKENSSEDKNGNEEEKEDKDVSDNKKAGQDKNKDKGKEDKDREKEQEQDKTRSGNSAIPPQVKDDNNKDDENEEDKQDKKEKGRSDERNNNGKNNKNEDEDKRNEKDRSYDSENRNDSSIATILNRLFSRGE